MGDMNMFDNFSEKLKTLRINSNLTRQQVADRVGVTMAMVSFYENGDRLPSLKVLVKLASLYKVSVDYLLDIKSPNKNNLSTEGLSDKQIKSLQEVIDCYRNLK